MGRSSNAHNFLISRRNALKFSPFVDGLPYYKLMPCGHDENSSSRDGSGKSFGAADFHTPITRYRNIVAGGCAWQYLASVGPIRVQNLKAIRALESGTTLSICLGPMGKQEISYCGRGARTMIFSHRVSSFIGQHFGKKIGLLPTAGAENHAFGVSHPPLVPTKFEKSDLRENPGTYCK